jgi:hypothetical protein
MSRVKMCFSGKRLLGAALMMFLTGLAIWQISSRSGAAQSVGGFEGLIVTVTPIGGQTFDLNSVSAGAPFSVEGDIAFVNERGQKLNDATGKFYRTGMKLSPSGVAVVQDVYVIRDFNGAIMAEGVLSPGLVAGAEQPNLIAVVGGIGTYRGAIGEFQLLTNANGSFTARLLEVPRRKGDDRVR